jgi:1,2-phenylacetyl-CoA epoxidase PaaB subunit
VKPETRNQKPETATAQRTTHSIADTKLWEVYARRKYEEPLYQVGTVAADDPDLGTVYARTIFNEFPWIEMVLVPRETMVRVITP